MKLHKGTSAMPDKKANMIIAQLCDRHPDLQIAHTTHELSHDTFIAQKTKHLAHGGIGGVIGIVLTPDNKIILAHRSQLNAGWSLPGGTVERNEDFEATFNREIAEEVGVQLSTARLVCVEKKRFVAPSREELYFVLGTYVARTHETTLPPPTPESREEGLKIQLFNLNELPHDMIFDDKKKVETFCLSL